jgi:acyl-CoA reductase-like NAD-dependent aldehyde dehydrogenase
MAAQLRSSWRLQIGAPCSSSLMLSRLLSGPARRVEEAHRIGPRLLTGGRADPPCCPATVLTDVPAGAEIAFEETFGPGAILEVVDDARAASERENVSKYGLTTGILTGDSYRGLDLARQLESGIVHVNDQPVNDEPLKPFGGVKGSGFGRSGLGYMARGIHRATVGDCALGLAGVPLLTGRLGTRTHS